MSKPAKFHPWTFLSQHSKREDFPDDYSYWRRWAEILNLSVSARLRLEWLIFYLSIGKENGSLTAKHFGISRRVFIKWKTRFNPKDLNSLENLARAPKTRRKWTVTRQEEERTISVRKTHIKWGKDKLKREYRKIYGEEISTNKIQKVINKHNLYPEGEKRKLRLKTRARRKNKTYIQDLEKKEELGFLWHTDAIILWWYGARKVIFTAIEELTKIGYAKVYSTNSSKNAKDFLERLLYISNNEVTNIHHDHGSEFFGEFEEACGELGIKQIFSRVRTPTDNASLERFNWTIQDEWLSLSEVGLDDFDEANQDLTHWLIEYNNERPHQSLDYLTPLEYATKNFKVSPMWASSTVI